MPDTVSYEIMFVDDSDDETVRRLEGLARSDSRIRYLHRDNGSGLSTAILEGFAIAQGDWFIVMDADMQHPPESLPRVIEAIRLEGADIIVPSRFIPGGSDGGLNVWRKLVSWTARMMARMSLRKVRSITDPTSGYFAVRRQAAFSKELNPIGWKILLEILARSEYNKVVEIPYSFEARDLGSSKFNWKEQANYVRHLIRLVGNSEPDLRFWKFCAVGLSGVIVNSTCYVLLVTAGLPIAYSFIIATLVATINNFTWNNTFTWKHAKTDSLWYRMLKFSIVSLGGLGVSTLVVDGSHRLLDFHYLFSGLTGIVVSTGWNFAMNSIWTFRTSGSSGSEAKHPADDHKSNVVERVG
ncbi:dolichol monophosphate mannose synthase [Cohnella xylanilytica]|nr:dolichol monophosphate mannose synthase [Cohnella xylanilytica]